MPIAMPIAEVHVEYYRGRQRSSYSSYIALITTYPE